MSLKIDLKRPKEQLPKEEATFVKEPRTTHPERGVQHAATGHVLTTLKMCVQDVKQKVIL